MTKGGLMVDAAVIGTSEPALRIVEACQRVGVDVVHLVEPSADLEGAPLVVEASAGPAAGRHASLARIAELVAEDTVVVAQTRTDSVTELATSARNPVMFLGLHLVTGTTFVEIVKGQETGASAVDAVTRMVSRAGFDSICVRDRPGFLLDRLALPYLNQAIRELDEGIGDLADIDRAMRLGLGYPRGPFEVLDQGGLDQHLAATSAVYDQTQAAEFFPPPLLRRMVTAGRLGTTPGSGFHPLEEHR